MGEPCRGPGATVRGTARWWEAVTDAVPLLLAVVVLFSLFRYVHDVSKVLMEAPFIDFAHYYTNATIVRRGENLFDQPALGPVDERLQIRRAQAPANYPPLFYLLMRPWILLPFRPAAFAWAVAGQICLGVTAWLCLRQFPAAPPARIGAAVFVLLNYQPLMENLALGQVNVFLLALMAAAWVALRTHRPWIVAGAVAVAVHTKAQYALLLPLLGWLGYWGALVRATLLAGLGVAVGLLALGLDHNISYARYILAFPTNLLTWTANLSPAAVLHRLLAGLPGGPSVAHGLSLAVAATLLWVFARAVPRGTRPLGKALDWGWGLGLAAVPLFSPLTEEHHLVVLLLPLTFLLLGAPDAPLTWIDHVLVIAGVLLLGSRYSLERFPAVHQGIPSFLLAGKLLGVAALAWALMRRLTAMREAGP